jgi:hypothetical protein
VDWYLVHVLRTRHRLNRGGDRQAKAALWRVAIVRMGTDQRTRDYVTRRISEGRTNPRSSLPQAVHRPGSLQRTHQRTTELTVGASLEGGLLGWEVSARLDRASVAGVE